MKRILALLLALPLAAMAVSGPPSVGVAFFGTAAQGGGGGGASSVTGTANQITASPTTGAVVLSLPTTIILPGNSITFAGGSSLTDNGSGQLTIAAAGTNQNIVLTPSGTGQVVAPVGSTNATAPGIAFLGNLTTGVHLTTSHHQMFCDGGADIFEIYSGGIISVLAGSAASTAISIANSTNTGIYGTSTSLSFATIGINALTLSSSQNATFAGNATVTNGLIQAGGSASAGTYGAVAPIVVSAKSVTILTSTTPADIATITVPSGYTRYRLFAVVGSGATGNNIIAETAAGTLAGATFTAWDAAGGTGVQLCSSASGPASAGTAVAWTTTSSTNFSTTGTIYIRQTANSANAGTCSFYLLLQPML